MKPWKHRCRVACKFISGQNIRSQKEVAQALQRYVHAYRHFQMIPKPGTGYMNGCGRMRATWLSVEALHPATNSESWVQLALEKDLNPPPEQDISPLSLFENVQLRLIHTVFLWALKEKLARAFYFSRERDGYLISFYFQLSQRSRGRVWAHLALSRRVLRTLPHSTSLSLELEV